MDCKKGKILEEFLLHLYKRRALSQHTDWSLKKNLLDGEFKLYAQKQDNFRKLFANYSELVKTLIQLKFIIIVTNTKYEFNGDLIYDLVSQRIFEFDEKSKLSVFSTDPGEQPSTSRAAAAAAASVALFTPPPVVRLSSNVIVCKYMGSMLQERRRNFVGDELSCYICQIRFESLLQYEQHVDFHSDEMNLEFTKMLLQWIPPVFSIGVRRCSESTGLYFTISTTLSDIWLHRILIVLPYTMLNVMKTDVPCRLQRMDAFCLDSSILLEFQMYPIVVMGHRKDDRDNIIIEQHNFMLTSTARSVPTHSGADLKVPAIDLYVPSLKILELGGCRHIPDNVIMETSAEMRDFMMNRNTLSPLNICGVFRTLLHLEDANVISDYCNFLQHNVGIERVWNDMDTGYVYSMKVKVSHASHDALSLVRAINRVALVPETQYTRQLRYMTKVNFVLKHTFGPHEIWGIVKSVSHKTITFILSRYINTQIKYMVVIQPTRVPIRLQQWSIDSFMKAIISKKEHYVFPTHRGELGPSVVDVAMRMRPMINEQIRNDPNQFAAVQRIVDGREFKAPYIILGPPGSGKTTTVVEAILQLYMHNPNARILVVSSTNYVCDDIALRLLNGLLGSTMEQSDQSPILRRIYAKSRAYDDVNGVVRHFSNLQNEHRYPNLEELAQYRIIVCTLSTVALLGTGGFGIEPACQYTHVFVDEVQSSIIPEVLSAVCVAIASEAALIISGDYKQLPPVVRSECAKKFGLQVSLMEHLFKNDCYRTDDKGNYDTAVQIRLRNNYRSHKDIVDLFSKLFYDGELKALAPPDVNWYSKFSINPDYPIMFDAQFGYSRHPCNQMRTSLYNDIEIEVVLDYVNELLLFGVDGKEVSKQDIGIISPYKAQYIRIREELHLRKWGEIETGSVEMFQGREKPIIIVSFVRSLGIAGTGFLKEERRLNVILSRPKSLLIMIGNPQTLSTIACYRQIIEECQNHKTLLNFTVKGTTVPTAKKNKRRPRRKKTGAVAALANGLANLKIADDSTPKNVG